VDAVDVAETLASRPSGADPALVRLCSETLALMGSPVSVSGHRGWPAQPSTPVGRQLPVWAYLALVPRVLEFHRSRGIPPAVSWASLRLASALRAHRAVTGVSGLGLFDGLWGPPLEVRGVMYTLGRLDFHLGELSLSNGPCGFTLGVHVPGGSPLSPSECDASLARASGFFARHFPEQPIALLHCDSWLLDRQLATYLPASSNIVRFQRRFQLLPDVAKRAHDGRVLEYVFGRSVPPDLYSTLPRETTLQRAIIAHLRAGGHWYVRTGWLPRPVG
jgi:GNAT-like C-terminal domain/N-acyltransferase N-terminal domain